jgi:phosphatidylglycerol:prolipoprotein diacylglycerol transferase
MKPELFHIGGITLYSYGFFILLGMVAAFLHLFLNRKRLQMDVDSISELILWCGVGVFVGGKLFFFFENPYYYSRHLTHFFTHLGDGFVFYGSFLVTLPLLFWWFRKQGWDFWDRMDDVGIAGAWVHALGKLGCLMAGCCHGLVCKPGEWGIVFTDPRSHAEPLGEALYPVQLWDAGIILMSIVGMYLLQKRGKSFSGQVFLIYCVVYGIGRFITESYRGDGERGFVFDGLMSHSQWIALLVLTASSLLYVYLRKRGLKQTV